MMYMSIIAHFDSTPTAGPLFDTHGADKFEIQGARITLNTKVNDPTFCALQCDKFSTTAVASSPAELEGISGESGSGAEIDEEEGARECRAFSFRVSDGQ